MVVVVHSINREEAIDCVRLRHDSNSDRSSLRATLRVELAEKMYDNVEDPTEELTAERIRIDLGL